MNKAELLTAVSEKSNLQKSQVEQAIKGLIEVIREQVAAGVEISLPELGKFVRTDKAARIGRNPATGEAMEIQAKKVPTFKAAKSFKDIVNQ